jgi:folylpolyglutamate synthase
VRLAKSFLQSQTGPLFEESDLPESFKRGLTTTKWPGRCQTVLDPIRKDVTWYLDGAHTVESLDCCMQWFVSPGVGLVSLPVVDEKYDHPMTSDASRRLI